MSLTSSSTFKTYFHSIGEGKPLFLIHGVGLDHTMWNNQVQYFSDKFRVYVYDLIGHGKSEKIKHTSHSIDHFSLQLYELMEEEEIDRAHIIGFSLGGLIAQHFAINYGSKVESLIIAHSVAKRTINERKSILERVQLVKNEGLQSIVDAAINRWFTKKYRSENKKTIQNIESIILNNDHDSYVQAYSIFASADEYLWDQLDQINQPTFIITGEDDVGSHPKMAKALYSKIEDSEVCIVPKARHMLPVEDGHSFNINIDRFLKNKR